MKFRTKYNLTPDKRSALLMAAPNTKWQWDLESDLLKKYESSIPDHEMTGDFKTWINTGRLVDTKTLTQILSVCETQCVSVKGLLYECVMELPDVMFGSVLYVLGHNATGIRGRVACILLLSEETIRTIYQDALTAIANLVVEKSIDSRSVMVIPLEGVLFAAYDLSEKGNHPITVSDLAKTIGCTEDTVVNHSNLLSLYGNLLTIADDDDSDLVLAITGEGIGLVDRMRATGRCWFHPGLVLRRYINSSFTGDLSDLSQETEIPIQNLCGILDGNYAIGKHDAQGLARVFDRPAQYWLSLQNLYLANEPNHSLKP